MNGDPYGDEIKRLAARPDVQVPRADQSARLDNPLCGDRVTLELSLEDGRITAIGHTVKGCLLCRAAAAALSDLALGLDDEGGARLLDEMSAMLRNGMAPAAGLAPFVPVRPHKSRHGCVLLPFKALVKALGR